MSDASVAKAARAWRSFDREYASEGRSRERTNLGHRMDEAAKALADAIDAEAREADASGDTACGASTGGGYLRTGIGR